MNKKKNSVYKIKGGQKFNTISVGRSKKAAKHNDDIVNVISLLTTDQNKEFKHITLNELKGAKGRELLIDAIESCDDLKKKQLLFAACWESGNDFSAYLPFFISNIPDADIEISMDIFNVIEEMQGPFESNLIKQSISVLTDYNNKNTDHTKHAIVNEIVTHLNHYL